MTQDTELLVSSPSYLLDNTYTLFNHPNTLIHHLDLYRLADSSSAISIRSLEDILDISNIFKQCICIVEWSEMLPLSMIPADRLEVSIFADDAYLTDTRTVSLAPHSARWEARIKKIETLLTEVQMKQN